MAIAAHCSCCSAPKSRSETTLWVIFCRDVALGTRLEYSRKPPRPSSAIDVFDGYL